MVSLFGVMDRNRTPMGSRLLGQWLSNPLTKLDEINRRHDAVGELVGRTKTAERASRLFERGLRPTTFARARSHWPRHAEGLESHFQDVATDSELKAKLTAERVNGFSSLKPTSTYVRTCKRSSLRHLLIPARRKSRMVASSRTATIRNWTSFGTLPPAESSGSQTIKKIFCEKTGIPSLKVGFNKVFGYYLEVTNTHKDKVPADFIRKQTLKNAERYITPELKDYEEKVLSADTQANELELQLFDNLRQLVRGADFSAEIQFRDHRDA